MKIPKHFEKFERLKLSKFIGRDSVPADKHAISRIEEAFAPAKDEPAVVWKNWTDWQIWRKK